MRKKERIKRGRGGSGQALKRNEKGEKNRPNIPTPFTYSFERVYQG
jgi:hypothetical protein